MPLAGLLDIVELFLAHPVMRRAFESWSEFDRVARRTQALLADKEPWQTERASRIRRLVGP